MKRIWSFVVSLFLIFSFQNANAQLFPIVPPGGFAIMEIPISEVSSKIYGDIGLKPGFYRIYNFNSGLCLINNYTFGLLPAQFLSQNWQCGDDASLFAILPTNDSRYTVRPLKRDFGKPRLSECVTVARGVVFGAPRIDILPCEIPIGENDWGNAGVEDQKFTISSVGNGHFKIEPKRNECWAIREASRFDDADVLQWKCTDGADQKWRLDYVRPISASEDVAGLNKKYWYQVNDTYLMAKPVGGWFFIGKQISKFANPNDYGKKCGMHCLDNASCKAFTWRPAALDNSCNGESCCILLSGITSAQTPNDGSYSGVVQR